MIKLIKKVIPTWKCREVGYLAVLGVMLVVRTMLTIWLADVNGMVVKAIVNKDLKQFIYRVSYFLNIDFRPAFVRAPFVHDQLCD